LAADILLSKYAHIQQCTDGGESVEVISACHPDILLLDINMPHMHGTHILSQVRPLFPEMSVIIVSGEHDVTAVQKCMHLGANEYITKTYAPDKLLEAVTFWWHKMQRGINLSTAQAATEFAHDLCNPLASMHMAVSVLQRELASNANPQVSAAIRVLDDATTYGLYLARSWREIGQQLADRDKIELHSFLRAFQTSYFPQVQLHIHGEDTSLVSSRVGMHRILQNLFQNSVEADPATRIDFHTAVLGNRQQLRLRISDAGPGLNPDQIREFNAQGKLTTTKNCSAGLGLTITSRVVMALGGTIHVKPLPKGIQFELVFPL
jgi:signal transduction histidine kinase